MQWEQTGGLLYPGCGADSEGGDVSAKFFSKFYLKEGNSMV